MQSGVGSPDYEEDMLDNATAYDQFDNSALTNNAGGIGAGNNRANLAMASLLTHQNWPRGGFNGYTNNPFEALGPDAAAIAAKWGPRVGKVGSLLGATGAGTVGWLAGKVGEDYLEDWHTARLSPDAANNPLTYQNWDGSWNGQASIPDWVLDPATVQAQEGFWEDFVKRMMGDPSSTDGTPVNDAQGNTWDDPKPTLFGNPFFDPWAFTSQRGFTGIK